MQASASSKPLVTSAPQIATQRPSLEKSRTNAVGATVASILDDRKDGSEYLSADRWIAWIEEEILEISGGSKSFAKAVSEQLRASMYTEVPTDFPWEVLRHAFKRQLRADSTGKLEFETFAFGVAETITHTATNVYRRRGAELSDISIALRKVANEDWKNRDLNKFAEQWETVLVGFKNFAHPGEKADPNKNPYLSAREATYSIWAVLKKSAETAMKEDPSLRKPSIFNTPVSQLVSSLLGKNSKK